METLLILASHGSLAEGLASAGRMIMGDAARVEALGLDRWETPQAIEEQVTRLLRGYEGPALILCDIAGGSVHNRLLPLCKSFGVSVVTGMNLTVLLELMVCAGEAIPREKIEEILQLGRKGIAYFDREVLEKLEREEPQEGEDW